MKNLGVKNNYGKAFVVIAVIAALVGAWMFFPIGDWAQAFSEYAESMGLIGVAIFFAVYVLATVFMLPASTFTLAAGLAYGFWGIPIVLVSATAGACAAFLIGRFFFRDRIKKYASNKPKIKAIRESVDQDGWKVAGLLRLSPVVPFNLQNYLFGATEIPFWQYALTTFFGIAPGTALYVYIGTLGNSASEASGMKLIFLAVGLIATGLVYFLIQKKVGAILKKSSDQQSR